MGTDFEWIATGSTNATLGGNWLDTSAQTTGTAPTAHNTRLIIGAIGTSNLETNIDFSAYTGQTVFLKKSATAQIGLETAGVVTPFKLGAGATIVINANDNSQGSGTPLAIFDVLASATIICYGTNPSPTNAAYPPVEIRNGGAAASTGAVFNIYGGTIGIATRNSTTCLVASLNLIASTVGGTPTVNCGRGMTLTTAYAGDGLITSVAENASTAAATFYLDGGNLTYNGTGNITAINITDPASTCIYNGTGTVATVTNEGTMDFSGDTRTKTVTNYTGRRGSTLNIDNGIPGGVVLTNAPYWPDGLGPDRASFVTPAGVKGTLVVGP